MVINKRGEFQMPDFNSKTSDLPDLPELPKRNNNKPLPILPSRSNDLPSFPDEMGDQESHSDLNDFSGEKEVNSGGFYENTGEERAPMIQRLPQISQSSSGMQLVPSAPRQQFLPPVPKPGMEMMTPRTL